MARSRSPISHSTTHSVFEWVPRRTAVSDGRIGRGEPAVLSEEYGVDLEASMDDDGQSVVTQREGRASASDKKRAIELRMKELADENDRIVDDFEAKKVHAVCSLVVHTAS